MTNPQLKQPYPVKLTDITELLLELAKSVDKDGQTELRDQLCICACTILEYLHNPICSIDDNIDFPKCSPGLDRKTKERDERVQKLVDEKLKKLADNIMKEISETPENNFPKS